jgi:hypothetical protein
MRETFKKGVFSVITTFLVIVALVFSLIAFIGLYSLITQTNTDVNKNVDYMVNVKLFRDHLMLCHKKTALMEEKLNTTECSSMTEGIKGYKVLQQKKTPDCEEKVWDFGDLDETSGKYVYWVSVEQINGNECLAKLVVYY